MNKTALLIINEVMDIKNRKIFFLTGSFMNDKKRSSKLMNTNCIKNKTKHLLHAQIHKEA